MDNLGDWLYILIIIAVGVSSIFSSSKKKKQAGKAPKQPIPDQPHEQAPVPAPKTFWEILEEAQRQVEPQPQRQKPAPRPVAPTPKAKPQPIVYQTAKSTFTEGERSIPDGSTGRLKPSIFVPDEEPPLISTEDFLRTEELKKAVIYSEILNRKY